MLLLSSPDATDASTDRSAEMNCTYVVGLTGGIGSGKTTAANLFVNLGVELIDADLLAREVVKPGTAALTRIAEYFGNRIIRHDGSLHRQLLREIIFSDSAKKAWLENLLHPLIADLMRYRIASCNSSYCLLVSPLLLESGQQHMVDRMLVVDVSEETQLTRTLKRDKGDAELISVIIASQIGRRARLQLADDILDNESGLDELNAQVNQFHQNYLRLAEESRESK